MKVARTEEKDKMFVGHLGGAYTHQSKIKSFYLFQFYFPSLPDSKIVLLALLALIAQNQLNYNVMQWQAQENIF